MVTSRNATVAQKRALVEQFGTAKDHEAVVKGFAHDGTAGMKALFHPWVRVKVALQLPLGEWVPFEASLPKGQSEQEKAHAADARAWLGVTA